MPHSDYRSLHLLTLFVLANAGLCAQQRTDAVALVTSPRPLLDASDQLQERTGRVISYEEPLLLWRGELEGEDGRDPARKWGLFPKRQRVLLPTEDAAPLDVASSLNRKVEMYNAQTPGTRFRVLSSKWGLHVIPAETRDESGGMRPARSLLDTQITVPLQERTAREHLAELTAAVTRANGIRVEMSAVPGSRQGFDNAFQAVPAKFAWGTQGLAARDALIDLLERSATTFSWRLLCQSSAQAEDRFCVLNVGMIEVNIIDAQGKPVRRVLQWDRCRNCALPGDRKSKQ